MIRFILVLVMTAAGHMSVSSAHEGHDKLPGSVSAPHGGQMRGTEDLYLEIVPNSKGFTLYVTDHDLKPIPLSKVQIKGTYKLPRQPQGQALKLSEKKGSLEAEVSVTGAHRYAVELNVVYAGRSEQLKFNVEPQ